MYCYSGKLVLELYPLYHRSIMVDGRCVDFGTILNTSIEFFLVHLLRTHCTVCHTGPLHYRESAAIVPW